MVLLNGPLDRATSLTSNQIDEILSMTLIANLATLDDDGGIHVVPMWFLRLGDGVIVIKFIRKFTYSESADTD